MENIRRITTFVLLVQFNAGLKNLSSNVKTINIPVIITLLVTLAKL